MPAISPRARVSGALPHMQLRCPAPSTLGDAGRWCPRAGWRLTVPCPGPGASGVPSAVSRAARSAASSAPPLAAPTLSDCTAPIGNRDASGPVTTSTVDRALWVHVPGVPPGTRAPTRPRGSDPAAAEFACRSAEPSPTIPGLPQLSISSPAPGQEPPTGGVPTTEGGQGHTAELLQLAGDTASRPPEAGCEFGSLPEDTWTADDGDDGSALEQCLSGVRRTRTAFTQFADGLGSLKSSRTVGDENVAVARRRQFALLHQLHPGADLDAALVQRADEALRASSDALEAYGARVAKLERQVAATNAITERLARSRTRDTEQVADLSARLEAVAAERDRLRVRVQSAELRVHELERAVHIHSDAATRDARAMLCSVLTKTFVLPDSFIMDGRAAALLELPDGTMPSPDHLVLAAESLLRALAARVRRRTNVGLVFEYGSPPPTWRFEETATQRTV